MAVLVAARVGGLCDALAARGDMDVQCPKCHQTVVIRRELGESEKLVTHCPTCETAFIVKRKPKAAPTQEAGAARPAPDLGSGPLPAGSTWHIRKQDGTILSFQSIRTLQTWVIAGIVSHDDQISRKGVQWKRIGALPELASFIEKTRKLHEDAGSDFVPPPSPAARGALRAAAAPLPVDEEEPGLVPVPLAGEISEPAPLGERPSTADAFAPPKTSWTHDELPLNGRPPTRAADGRFWRWAFLLLLLAGGAAFVLVYLMPEGDGPARPTHPPIQPQATLQATEPTAPVAASPMQGPGESARHEVAAAGTPGGATAPAPAEPDEGAPVTIEIVDEDAGAEGTAAPDAGAPPVAPDEAALAAARAEAEQREAAEKAAAETAAAETAAAERAAAEKAAAEKAAAEKAAAEKAAAERAAAERAAAEKAAAAKAAAEKAGASRTAAEKAAAEKAAAEKAAAKAAREAREAKAQPPVERLSEDYDALMDQANGLFSSNPSQAAVLYAKASRAQPNLVEPVAQLGWCYLQLGNTAKAFQFFKQAIRMSPRYTDSYRGLARAFEQSGYKREACEEYGRYLKKVPATSGRAQQTRDRMQKLGCE